MKFKKKAIFAYFWCSISFCSITNAESVDDKMSLKGIWLDSSTGLFWMRCSLGQVWTGKNCKGDAKEYSWWDAIRAADKYTFNELNDWRVPSTLELSSLLAGDVVSGQAAYDQNNGDGSFFSLDGVIKEEVQKSYAYSGVKGYKQIGLFQPLSNKFGSYWSAVPFNNSYTWLLDFDYGGVGRQAKSNKNYVRLVRAGSISDDFEKSVNLVKNGDVEEQDYIKEWTEENARQAKIAAEEKAQRDRAVEAEHREQLRLSREAALSPQAMYLQAGKYDRNGQQSDAVRLYELLIEKFPNHALAVQSNNRLVDIKSASDAASAERSRSAAERSRASDERSRASSDCRSRKASYRSSCYSISDSESAQSCFSRVDSICSE